ncbi:CcmD family protein [Sediminibacterium sp.]|uniref:CcmD family protein n=1 Tax=Sediminibacterium sp. TaxID=1917865 RepID=UPI003F69FAFB
MTKLKYCLLLLTSFLLSSQLMAQDTDQGLMRSNGKIFVVMAVVLTILAGLFAYLISLDKKIARLEKEGFKK